MSSENENTWKGSPEVWIGAAIDIFLESGIDAVKISTVAKRLKLSRTSFYWFFKDRDVLLQALLNYWKDKNTGSMIKQSEAYADSLTEAALNIFDCWLDTDLFDARLEFAIRSWGLNSEEVCKEVQFADQQRLSALMDMFKRYGVSGVEADVHSRTLYLVQIGYITMQAQESKSIRMRRMAEYVKTFTGELPQQHELQRFYHRHNYIDEKIKI